MAASKRKQSAPRACTHMTGAEGLARHIELLRKYGDQTVDQMMERLEAAEASARSVRVTALADAIKAASWAIHDVGWPRSGKNYERRVLATQAVAAAIDALSNGGRSR